jgi:hypothetical protein
LHTLVPQRYAVAGRHRTANARWANTISTFAIAVLIAIDRTSDFQEY